MEVLVFGGTSEGRWLAERLGERGTCKVVYCAATDYGASLVANRENVTVLRGPLTQEQKAQLMAAHDFACVVDATHPFARHISTSIDRLAKEHNKDVVRVVRESTAWCPAKKEGPSPCVSASTWHVPAQKRKAGTPSVSSRPWVVVATVDEAARVVAATPGNVLLTTGTKDLASFVQTMPEYRERLYVRILPVRESLAATERLGIPASHVVAMQGPFSTELNCAFIRELHIATLVTKQSGQAGGFDQKAEAALVCGIELVVIQRPADVGGVSLDEALRILEEDYGL